MKKKILMLVLSLVCVLACAIGFAACESDNTVHVTKVTLNTRTLDLETGEEATLIAEVLPENATDKTVTWTVDDNSVVTVDNNGKVTAISEGVALVRATADNAYEECEVSVKEKVLVQWISMERSITLLENGEATLAAAVSPENAKSKVIWSVEPTGIVSVDEGKITALAQGEATVTAKADDATAQCSVTVTFDGLMYQLNEDGQSYSVVQNYHSLFTGEHELTDITVASEYNGKPVTGISQYAFSSIDNLQKVAIPASVTSIDDSVFYRCDSLTTIAVDENNPQFASVDGILYNKAITESVCVPYGITGVVEIPESMTVITDFMFQNRKKLSGVKLHDGVTTIGRYAFDNCIGLNSFTVTKNVTAIEDYAFDGCYKLWEIYNLSNLEIETGGDVYTAPNGKIGLYALLVHTSETSPSGIHKTDDGFTFCTANANTYLVDYTGTDSQLTLPAGYERNPYIIHSYAFFDNDFVTSITVPDGALVGIEGEAFSNCDKLEEITLPSSLTDIGIEAFSWCSISNITYNGTVAQWNAIRKNAYWNRYMGEYTISCTDGVLDKDGNITAE